jgi:transposase
MEHVAIDLGGRKSQVCVRDATGTILLEQSLPTARLGTFLAKRPKSRVILETCAEAFRVADAALERQHEVRVVPATLVRALGVGARGMKTDQRDARALSEASCRTELPSVHIPSARARDLRSRSTAREVLISSRTALINSARGYLRQHGIRVRSQSVSFPQKVRQATQALPEGLPAYIEDLLQAVEAINVQLARADTELKELAQNDEVCQRLMTVPGVGPVTAIRFWAALDDHLRFGSAHMAMAYLGLTPGQNSSSDHVRRTGITKAGPASVRRTLVQAAWVVKRGRPMEPMCQWATEIEKRRGKQVAIVALARKMAGILFAIWRDGTEYTPRHTKTPAQLS